MRLIPRLNTAAASKEATKTYSALKELKKHAQIAVMWVIQPQRKLFIFPMMIHF